jgi:hypothetical protein
MRARFQSAETKARVRLAIAFPACHIRSVRRALTSFAAAIGFLAAAGSMSGCSLLASNRAVVLSTAPPGASVFVDGRNIGFVTPCQVQLDIDADVRLDFEIPGFKRETRFLTSDDEVYSILWREMYVGEQTWRFPLWLPLKDVLVPVKWTETHSPGRVHVVLDRLADEGVPQPAPQPGPPAETKPAALPAETVPTPARAQ